MTKQDLKDFQKAWENARQSGNEDARAEGDRIAGAYLSAAADVVTQVHDAIRLLKKVKSNFWLIFSIVGSVLNLFAGDAFEAEGVRARAFIARWLVPNA